MTRRWKCTGVTLRQMTRAAQLVTLTLNILNGGRVWRGASFALLCYCDELYIEVNCMKEENQPLQQYWTNVLMRRENGGSLKLRQNCAFVGRISANLLDCVYPIKHDANKPLATRCGPDRTQKTHFCAMRLNTLHTAVIQCQFESKTLFTSNNTFL